MTEAKTPVYFVIGESDEYYGSEPFKEAYQILYELYAEQGLAKSEIDNLLVLDIKEKNYFAGTKVTYQHGGGYLFRISSEIFCLVQLLQFGRHHKLPIVGVFLFHCPL